MIPHIKGYKILTSNQEQKYFPLRYKTSEKNGNLIPICDTLRCHECALFKMDGDCHRNQKQVAKEKRIKLYEILY